MGRVFEIASTGLDEFLQVIGGDPWRGASSFGLRVPGLATPDPDHRYLFLGCAFSIADGATAKLRGYRQFASIGKTTPGSGEYAEMPIQSPNWRLPDGNISWHLRRLGPPNAQGLPRGVAPLDLASFKKDWADGPCLLYKDYTIAAGNRIYTQLTSYTPPMLGRPWGTPLRSQQDFYDLRTPWRDAHAWSSLDVEIDGPDTIGFFISVRQSAGLYGVVTPPLSFPNGYLAEDQFCGNFGGGTRDNPRPIYWRVGAALIVEV